MTMDMTETIAPKSDQLNADDLIANDVTVTIERVSRGNPEQPVDVHLIEFPGRAYRPSKSMRRVLVAMWGKDADQYAGRRLTLYRDPSVKFGKDQVGGIKISHASHIDKPMSIALTVTRGKRALHKVTPLPDAPRQSSITADDIAAIDNLDDLRALLGQVAKGSPTYDLIVARGRELSATATPESTVNPETGEITDGGDES